MLVGANDWADMCKETLIRTPSSAMTLHVMYVRTLRPPMSGLTINFPELQAFSFTVDRLNDTATPLFLGHMKAFIEQQQAGPPDPYQSPRLRPLEGTVKQNPLILDATDAEEQKTSLIALLDSGTSSDDDAEADGAVHFLIRWEPQHGSINIMTRSIIAQLTKSTGCLFFPDHGKNCIGISGVNAGQALGKLKNLEKLQVLKSSCIKVKGETYTIRSYSISKTSRSRPRLLTTNSFTAKQMRTA